MRELEVLGNGHLRLDFADWKEFFETEMAVASTCLCKFEERFSFPGAV